MEKRSGGKAPDNGRTRKPRSVRNAGMGRKAQQQAEHKDQTSRNLQNATTRKRKVQLQSDSEDEEPINFLFRSLRNPTMDRKDQQKAEDPRSLRNAAMGSRKELQQAEVQDPRSLRNATTMDKKEQQRAEDEEPMILNVSLDLEAFDCPLCFSPFDAPIFQCKNGHAACEACCARVQGTCPSCHEPIGEIRCRPLEKAIASMLVPCAFAAHGCTRRLKHAEKSVHEALLCHYAPCACPLPGCGYSGLNLRDHIQDAHAGVGGDHGVVSFVRSAKVTLRRSTPFVVLLQETDARVFLLLNGGDVPSGRSLSVVCVGPRLGGNKSLEYELQVKVGALATSASGPVACTRQWAGHHPTEGFLFVPDAYWSSSSSGGGGVNVTVHVRKLTGDKV